MNSPQMRKLPVTFHERLYDAVRFWEPFRLLYNLILAALVVAWLVLTWPHFRPAFNLQSLLALLGLAGIANVIYCAAYFADLPIQHTSYQAVWRRWRWILWLGGTLLAFLFTYYWIADEIYPYVH